MQSVLHATLVTLAVAGTTCDFRATEETRYTAFNLTSLGINTKGRSICANGYFSGSTGHPQTLSDFLGQSEEYVRTQTLKLVPALAGGAETTDLIVLDIEYPVQYNDLWQYPDSLLASVVAAVRMRVQVARSIVPHAPLSFYGQHISSNATIAEGYARAAKLGLYDDVDYLVPVRWGWGHRVHKSVLVPLTSPNAVLY